MEKTDIKERYSQEDFFDIMKLLMSPEGCPWDSVQTHDSIKKCIIEEAYEVAEAIDNNDANNLCEELGDVFLQVVFHSLLAEKNNEFSFGDVVDGVAKKMINRHPFIFNEKADEKNDWDSIKAAEKGYKNNTEALKAIPKAMPALIRGQKIISKAQKFGYSINGSHDPYTNAINGINTLKTLENSTLQDKMEIVGNILFDLLKISSNCEINAEFALTKALEKGINRFENFENKK